MIQLSSESLEKLKRTTEWVGRLRRAVVRFNRCIDACKDEEINEVRIAIVEGFSKLPNLATRSLVPSNDVGLLLSAFADSVKYLRTTSTGKPYTLVLALYLPNFRLLRFRPD
jgi:hypothetical protein